MFRSRFFFSAERNSTYFATSVNQPINLQSKARNLVQKNIQYVLIYHLLKFYINIILSDAYIFIFILLCGLMVRRIGIVFDHNFYGVVNPVLSITNGFRELIHVKGMSMD